MKASDPSIGQTPAAARGHRAVRAGAAAVVVAGAIAVGYGALSPSGPPAPPPLPDLATLNEDREDGLLDVANPGYVGSQACAECHAARVSEFGKTAHARACRRPGDGPMPPGFEQGRGSYQTGDPDLHFEMTRRADGYFQTAVRRTPTGDRRVDSRIDLVYGAHRADEVFFTWRDDRLYELMTVWLHPTDEWANVSYDRHGDGGFARETTVRCLECHTTWFAHVPGTTNQYRPDSFVLGVTCEKCHGPGREHVAYHRTHPRAAAHAVVQPANLSRERQLEVCTQCHGNFTKPRGPANRYRPGEPLADYYRLAQTRHPEDDHVANQVKYLRESKCFQQSETLTCVTCHDPHRPHEPGDASRARAACAKCHEPEACGDRPNLPVAVRDDCAGCHMRPQVWMNVHFHTTDDRYLPPIRRSQHRIGIDPVARKEVLLAWHRSRTDPADRQAADRLARELAEHWIGEAEARRRDYRYLAAIGAAREALRVGPPPDLRERATQVLRAAVATQTDLDNGLIEARHAADAGRRPEAIERLSRLLEVKPDWATARSKLGTLCAAEGQFERAVEHLEQVARDDPDNASGLAMLGWLAYLGGRAAEAVEYYRRAEQIEPFDAKLRYHWGLALLRLNHWADAAGRFEQALQANPRHAGALQGLAHALIQQGRPADAVRPAWRAARQTQFADPDVLVTLAEAYAGAGRVPEAAAAATEAIKYDGARPDGPKLQFDVRRRMEQLRARGVNESPVAVDGSR